MTTINPGLRMVRLGADTVQIGLGPGGMILAGLHRCELAFLDALRQGITDSLVFKRAEELGVEAPRAQELCAALASHLFSDAELHAEGFRAERLLPEHASLLGLHQQPCKTLMSRREHAVVHLVGLGRTGSALAGVLVGAGVGTMLLEDDRPVCPSDVGPGSFKLSDLGLARSVAVRRRLLRIDPGCHAHILHDGGQGGPDLRCLDLAIVTGHDVVAANTAARFVAAERPHLFVVIREQDGTLGPLVIPGETACAECVDHHRGVATTAWQDGQVSSVMPGRHPGLLENVALATTLAGMAATHALLFLDAVNQPGSYSAVMTFHPENGRWTRQEFTTHPGCGCQWQNQPFATISKTASP
ncbi:TOMM precursor leader peptide-binding protein [Arthrobacter alpinus]|uniref:TOMM precursor leader peptide-binding protein n=1 Tax=Arthrobacter alpinus TaxID=656366 RepID=UPI0012FE8F55|nr:TOMM precursor leader peptide-binding protein [Arthrobacter alpinus]